jgi:hypothetical protein
MSEAERLQAELEKLKAKAETAEQESARLKQQQLEERRDSAFVQAAEGALNARRLLTIVKAEKPDDFAKTLNDDGTPNADMIKQLVEAAKADAPELFGTRGAGSPSNRGGRVNSDDEANKAAREKFRADRLKRF